MSTSRSDGPALAIVNPKTGRRAASAVVDTLQAAAERAGVELRVEPTQRAGHATELAGAHDGATRVIAVGGDGTVSDVITGTIGRSVPVAIVPTGSTNMIAKELGVPRALDAACELAVTGRHTVAIDVAQANGTTMAHMAGAGFDAVVMAAASSRLKRRVGWLAYLPPAIRNLTYPAFTATIEVDGVRSQHRARVILVALGPSIAHRNFHVGTGIDQQDGLVDICIYDPPGVLGTLKTVGWIVSGRPERSRWLSQLRGRHVVLNADRPVPYEVDGDPLGTLPLDVRVLDHRARIIVPKGTRFMLDGTAEPLR